MGAAASTAPRRRRRDRRAAAVKAEPARLKEPIRTSGMRMAFDVGGNFLQAMAKAVAARLTSHSAGGCKIEIVGYQEFDTTVSSFAATELFCSIRYLEASK